MVSDKSSGGGSLFLMMIFIAFWSFQGKNILGKNVTDRIFPVAKTIAKGVGQVGQGLSTFGELLPPVEFEEGSAIKLIPGKNEKKIVCAQLTQKK